MQNGNEKKNDYDNEPVVYCKNCGSLHIIVVDDNDDLCVKCGTLNFTEHGLIGDHIAKYPEQYEWIIQNEGPHLD